MSSYELIISDLINLNSKKRIGTDKGLAKIGDGIVNFTYSIAKSIYLTQNSSNKYIIRTGTKVNKYILSNALKEAGMKDFAKNRADAHDLADTVEGIVAYVWLRKKITVSQIIDLLSKNLTGNLQKRSEEIDSAAIAFTELLNSIKEYLPDK
ncbi:MAG: hypothetical protein GF383_05045 [Candidatus Lokiarchaeota archaeon]|nr:hypothetical protein [Candidatus Lokiarchaeota archaeon]MBD3339244.1 hypothetical protein [Candidatus Lokiarchaeota archaeon]